MTSLYTRSVLAVLMVLPLVYTSCQKERNTLGLDLIPEGEQLHMRVARVSDFSTWTDTLSWGVTGAFTNAPVGEVYDSLFGRCYSMVLSELYPLNLKPATYDEAAGLDSAFFVLRVARGAYDGELRVRVYALDTMVQQTAAVLNKKDFSDEALIADGVLPSGAAVVKIALEPDWARHFMANVAQKLGDPLLWARQFPGVRIVAERVDATSTGRMVSFNIGEQSNGLHFFWSSDSKVQTLQLGFFSYCRRFYKIDRDLAGSRVGAMLAQPREAQNASERIYVGEYGGGVGCIDFSAMVERWRDSMPICINRAELRVPVSPANEPLGDTLVTEIETLVRENGSPFRVSEAGIKSDVYRGRYLRALGYYSMNLTLTMQRMLEGGIPDNRLYLVPRGEGLGLSRVVLSNGQAKGQAMELVITYTR